MIRLSPALAGLIALAFGAGFLTPVLYQRWTPETSLTDGATSEKPNEFSSNGLAQSYTVTFVPLSAALPEDSSRVLPTLAARDVEKLRALAGQEVKIRGRVFRVGHSAKSNTYFLNFGPSREALTAVIFASAAELFEKAKLVPKNYENHEVEITGSVKDHPQFGLEVILENPKQIRIIN